MRALSTMSANDDDETVVRPFAGLTRHSEMTVADIPEVGGHGSSMKWWAYDWRDVRGAGADPDPDDIEVPGDGFTTVINSLPRATTVPAGWKNPVTGEWVETSKHNALVDPERVEAMQTDHATQEDINDFVDSISAGSVPALADEAGIDGDGDGPPTREEVKQGLIPGDDALYHIPTDSYEVINPAQSLMPLAEVLREEDFGSSVFGEFRVSRGGGRVSGDIYVDGMHVQTPETATGDGVAADGGGKPTVVGLEVGYDFFGDTAFRVRGQALRTSCMNAMRAVTDWTVVKHAGDIESRVDWKEMYRDVLEELDLKRDQLSQVIAEASEMNLDLGDLPDDFAADHDSILEAFYDYAGLPAYLAEEAARNARAEAADPFRPTWWDLHNGATYAITHHARGEAMGGGSIDRYNRIADDLLMNPPAFEERVEQEYEAAREEREDATLADEGGGEARIAAAFESVREKKERYQQRQEEMKQLVGEAGEAAD